MPIIYCFMFIKFSPRLPSGCSESYIPGPYYPCSLQKYLPSVVLVIVPLTFMEGHFKNRPNEEHFPVFSKICVEAVFHCVVQCS